MNPDLRLMSFNVRNSGAADGPNAWPHRKDFAGQLIRANAPDLVGMQEVLPDQLHDLRERLPGYESFGVGRDDGRERGESSPLFYRHDRFEIVDRGTWWLSPTPDAIGSKGWDASLPRIATWAILRDRHDAGRTLHVVNTHFDHMGEVARLESAKLLVVKLAAVTHPCILMGDLNCSDVDPPIIALSAYFTDTYRARDPTPDAQNEGTFHSFTGEPHHARIDFIFARGCEVRAAGIDRSHRAGRYPSDHFPVTAVTRCS